MSANTCFLSDFLFFKVSKIIIWNLWKYNFLFGNLSWVLWKFKKNEIRQKLDICWHCLFWFDLPTRKEEGKFKQGEIMYTKVCQRFLYSIPTLVTILNALISHSRPVHVVIDSFGCLIRYYCWLGPTKWTDRQISERNMS